MDERGRVREPVNEPLRVLRRTGAATTLLLLSTLPAWAVLAGNASASTGRDNPQAGQGHERLFGNPPRGVNVNQIIEDCRTGLRVKIRFPQTESAEEGIAKPAPFETFDIRAFDQTHRGISEGEEGGLIFYPGEGKEPIDKLELEGRSNEVGGIDVGINHLETDTYSIEQIPCGDPDYELVYLAQDPRAATATPALPPVGRDDEEPPNPTATTIPTVTATSTPTSTPTSTSTSAATATVTSTQTATPTIAQSPAALPAVAQTPSLPGAFDTVTRQNATLDTRIDKLDGEVGILRTEMAGVMAAATNQAVPVATMQRELISLRAEVEELKSRDLLIDAKRHPYLITAAAILTLALIAALALRNNEGARRTFRTRILRRPL